MRKQFGFLLTLIASATMIACSGMSSDSRAGAGVENNDVSTQTIEINGKDPRSYYDQFLFKTTGSCKDENVSFYFLSSDSFEIRTNSEGRKIFGKIDIVLLDKENFYGYIEEHEVYEGNLRRYQYRVTSKDGGYGKYAINQDGRIEIASVGSGRALTINDRDAVYFSFNENKMIQELEGKQTTLRYVQSWGSPLPGHQSFNEHCGRND